ncbi:hypothetical protein CAOG_03773 [Capsaspora owczarzaki ATCC 30864]|nr:hypothetical protein CAOG_03773 [Capsaspora owczarzaki ATCC 30864]|eukprot:XP_004363501.2 hypothetical protein CAOG_03773 [Capsaspora owczarzaki ATCC 30864]
MAGGDASDNDEDFNSDQEQRLPDIQESDSEEGPHDAGDTATTRVASSASLAEVSASGQTRKWSCSEPGCDKSYFRQTHLLRHQRTHSGDKPFKCTVAGCEWAYVNNYHLKRHMQTHNRELPYKCTFDGCSETFAKHSQLRTHMFVHTNVLPFACPEAGCDMAFLKACELRKHARRHSTSYACADCEAHFSKWSDYVAHRKAEHPAVKVCPHCRRTFKNRGSFRDHLRTHDPTRESFPCPIEGCGKFYFSIHARNTHVRSFHEQHKPFTCEVDSCGASFAHKHTLRAHVRRVHEQSVPPTPAVSEPNSQDPLSLLNSQALPVPNPLADAAVVAQLLTSAAAAAATVAAELTASIPSTHARKRVRLEGVPTLPTPVDSSVGPE